MIWEVGLIDLRGVFVDFGESHTSNPERSLLRVGHIFSYTLSHVQYVGSIITIESLWTEVRALLRLSLLTSSSLYHLLRVRNAHHLFIGILDSKFKTSYSGETGKVFYYWGGHSYLLLGIAISVGIHSPGYVTSEAILPQISHSHTRIFLIMFSLAF